MLGDRSVPIFWGMGTTMGYHYHSNCLDLPGKILRDGPALHSKRRVVSPEGPHPVTRKMVFGLIFLMSWSVLFSYTNAWSKVSFAYLFKPPASEGRFGRSSSPCTCPCNLWNQHPRECILLPHHSRSWAMKKGAPCSSGYTGYETLPSCLGIIINHYKYPPLNNWYFMESKGPPSFFCCAPVVQFSLL